MIHPPFRETTAILDATAEEISRNAAAILFAMWHYVEPDEDRMRMLGQFRVGDERLPLIEAMVATTRLPQWRGFLAASAKAAVGPVPSNQPALSHALRKALADVLGPRLKDMVAEAWVTALELTLAGHAAAFRAIPGASGSGGGT